jgi:hypothetical protein
MNEIFVNQVGLHGTFGGIIRKYSSCWSVEFSYRYSMLVLISCFVYVNGSHQVLVYVVFCFFDS